MLEVFDRNGRHRSRLDAASSAATKRRGVIAVDAMPLCITRCGAIAEAWWESVEPVCLDCADLLFETAVPLALVVADGYVRATFHSLRTLIEH